VDGDLADGGQEGAALGQLHGGGQRVGAEDGIPVVGQHGARHIADRAIGGDLLSHGHKRIAPVHEGAAQRAKPGPHACSVAARWASVSAMPPL